MEDMRGSSSKLYAKKSIHAEKLHLKCLPITDYLTVSDTYIAINPPSWIMLYLISKLMVGNVYADHSPVIAPIGDSVYPTGTLAISFYCDYTA